MNNITVIAGSLRKESINRTVMKEIMRLASDQSNVTEAYIGDLPLFNGDLEEGGDPEAAAEFKAAIRSADGIIIITPEYSHGVPGVLKNALDWAGSMTNENVLENMPAAVTGASPSALGTSLAQVQVKQTLAACGSHVLARPELFIGTAHKRLGDGRVTDETTISLMTEFLDAFYSWIGRFR
ncbi:NADPH-dependent FMN reductase [Alteribacter natronophilus]|uniref:NADPH-dependent FMN reductase n=1 Tax=Alteribacter natronophilus TaxID=2583810 RepID=UPI001486349A|nr:NAD(P)H-dependent oxidoreductase [Alteribacter natronophilus]